MSDEHLYESIDMYEDASDDDSDFSYEMDNEDYYNESDDYGLGEAETIHPLLEHDIEMVRERYSNDAIEVRMFETIDDIDVELKINMKFLDGEVANAWRIKRQEPLVIRLHMSLSRYLDASEPKVEVFQPSQKEKFGVGSQMRKILENFIVDQWKSLSNQHVESLRSPSHKVTPVSVSKKRRGQPAAQNSTPKERTPQSLPESSEGFQIKDSSVAKLVGMGFSTSIARNALTITRGEEEDAVNLILSETSRSPAHENSAAQVLDQDSGSPPLTPERPPRPPRPSRQQSIPKAAIKPKAGFKLRPFTLWGSQKEPKASEEEKFFPLTGHPKDSKRVPGLEYGFLVMIMRYAMRRLSTLNEFCVVCDEPHLFETSSMLKPTVCARELCVFAFSTLGVMSDAADDIATGAEVVDLLIAMAKAACQSHRRKIIFEPFPCIVDPKNTRNLALSPKDKNFGRVEQVLRAFPAMSKMTQLRSQNLKRTLDEADNLAYPLLQWLISSNRSHIVKLPPEKQLWFMRTPHQFLLLSSPPAKEAAFRQAKAQHGSIFAFHGSHMENWHSIIRTGLINASGTAHQVHGQAYGAGIYLSPHASLSFSYSGMGSRYNRGRAVKPGSLGLGRGRHGHIPSVGRDVKDKEDKDVTPCSYSRFLKSTNLTCIALCEVVNCSELRKTHSIWVMPNADYVCTRFFFVYEDGQYGDETIDTEGEGYKKAILQALGSQLSE